jgi:hypothetical protein
MLKFFRQKLVEIEAGTADSDWQNSELPKQRVEELIGVIEGYSKLTGIASSCSSDGTKGGVEASGQTVALPVAAPEVVSPPAPVKAPSVLAAVAAAAEMAERERVALPMQMEAFSKMVVLSEAQFNLYKRDFDAVDKDGSGKVDKQEVTALLAAQLGQDPRPDQVEFFLQKFDENKDGLITLEEWITAVVGKQWAVSSEVLEEPSEDKEGAPILDADGEPMAMGLIYVFKGGG